MFINCMLRMVLRLMVGCSKFENLYEIGVAEGGCVKRDALTYEVCDFLNTTSSMPRHGVNAKMNVLI
jgi:hypothetical protein